MFDPFAIWRKVTSGEATYKVGEGEGAESSEGAEGVTGIEGVEDVGDIENGEGAEDIGDIKTIEDVEDFEGVNGAKDNKGGFTRLKALGVIPLPETWHKTFDSLRLLLAEATTKWMGLEIIPYARRCFMFAALGICLLFGSAFEVMQDSSRSWMHQYS